MRVLFLLSLLAGSSAFGWSGWICRPQKGGKTEPVIIVVKEEKSGVSRFVLGRDLVRNNGRLPVGEYYGQLKLSKSGFSYFASLNLKDYFADPYYPGEIPWLTLVLPVKPSGLTSEGWIFWGDPDGDSDAEPLNHYGCQVVTDPKH